MPEPRYEHDCDHCVYLGQYEEYDLYYHSRWEVREKDWQETVIARYGDWGGDYNSGMIFSFGRIPALTQARLLAEEFGFRKVE